VLKHGTAPVRITVVQWPKQMEPELGLRAYRQFVVQLASNPDPEKARAIRDRLQERVGDTELRLDQPPGSNVTIIAGPYDNRRQARWVARRLQQAGVTSLVRSYRK
jgi:cell division protein FtsN